MKETIIPKSDLIPNGLFQTIQRSIPIACIDLIVLRKNNQGMIETLLIKRRIYPEIGKWCLIGGRIIKGEQIEDTIYRQAKIELGIEVEILSPWNKGNPVIVLSDPVSDIQKHFIVLVYAVTIKKGKVRGSGPESSEMKWFLLDKIPKKLGFAHKEELNAFINTKIPYSL